MRSAQNFDPFKIKIFGFKQAGAEQRRAIDVNSGRRITRAADAQIANAADGKAGACEIAFGKGHVGQGQLKVAGVFDLLLLKRLSAERRNRNRHFLQRLSLALGRYDDRIRTVFGCGIVRRWRFCLCISWRTHQQSECGHPNPVKLLHVTHLPSAIFFWRCSTFAPSNCVLRPVFQLVNA